MTKIARYTCVLTVAVAIAAWSTVADAATAAPVHVGYAAKVERDVEGKLGDADAKKIKIEDDIFFSEIITTEPDATAIMSFRDGSSLEIGPNSALTIDEFIFNPAEGVKTQTITALVGSFRFVSGMTMPNQTITINTPSATIGIRGSTLPLVVGSDGFTAAVPTDGQASFAPRGNPDAAVNIQRGNTGVIRPGGQPRTGPSVRSVGRQIVSRARQVFGARVVIPQRSQQRRTRDAQANQQPASTQALQLTPGQQQARQNATQAALAARQDQTLDNQGLSAVPQLDNAGVFNVQLSPNLQLVVDDLNDQTSALQVNLDAALQDGQAASQANHLAGTRDVIGGLSQIGDTNGVVASTSNAAQADPNQAAAAVDAAAANLQDLNANTLSAVLQSAADGLALGGQVNPQDQLVTLTASALNALPQDTADVIATEVVSIVATDNNLDVNTFNDDVQTTVVALATEPAAGDPTDTTPVVTTPVTAVVDSPEAENPSQDVSQN